MHYTGVVMKKNGEITMDWYTFKALSPDSIVKYLERNR